MDLLYLACVFVAGICLVAISLIIPWGVYARYVLNRADSWPEPMAILLTILLTFLGGAACYRTGVHMRVLLVRSAFPAVAQRGIAVLAEALMGLLAIFMVIRGAGLVQTTWFQEVPEFPTLSVGFTYLPIPIGGLVLLFFVIEQIFLGPPPGSEPLHATSDFD